MTKDNRRAEDRERAQRKSREDRLAEALRANLRKRKEQARARGVSTPRGGGGDQANDE